MAKYNIHKITDTMFEPEFIRNISLIAHLDTENSAITNSLLAAAGITIIEKPEPCYTEDSTKERGIPIKPSCVSLAYELNSRTYLINLIDSTGHNDLSSDTTPSMMINDGAVVIVDAVEGISTQTQTVLRRAMMERIRPVLMINNIDKAILEEKLEAEEIYQRIEKLINTFNEIVTENKDSEVGDISVHPLKGNVIIGVGKDNWAFTIQKYARIYSQKFETNEAQLAQKLWGDVFYDKETKKWGNEPVSATGQKLKRSFVQFIIEPIIKLMNTIIEGNKEQISVIIPKLNIEMTSDEENLTGKKLLNLVLSKWINLPETFLEMFILNLPSPKVAQKYRCSILYEGPQDDPCAIAIQNCDYKGPLMMYVSKIIPREEPGRFFAFGRVFAGTFYSGEKFRIMGPKYLTGGKEDLFIKSLQSSVVMMGEDAEFFSNVPCGNIVSLFGIDKSLLKNGTVSNCEEAHKIRNMKFSGEKAN